MGLTALKGKKSKKKTIRSKARTGLAGVPVEKGFDAVKEYFHLEVDKKDCISQVKAWVKKNFPEPAKYILSHPEWKFNMTHHAATAFWYNNDLYKNNDLGRDKAKEYLNSLFDYIIPLIETGKELYKQKRSEQKAKANVISISPQMRLERKIRNTIMQELLELEDQWIEGEDTTINLYDRFKYHGLTNTAISHVKPQVEGWLLDYEDAYYKRCEQAVEGYSHVKKSSLKHRIDVCKSMLEDMERIKSASKATRTIKISRPKAADKQVSKLQYKNLDDEYKIVSMHPIGIIGKRRLYTFNTKHRELNMYYTDDPKGFQVSGSTLKRFDKEQSIKIRLRKPNDILPLVLNKTPIQLQKELSALKTKVQVPNGRINNDTILLRVLDK
jgi:hypothetical protein